MRIAALALSAALTQEPWDDDPIVQLAPPWSHLEIGDWTYVGESNDGNMVAFFQPARQRGQVWVRYEYNSPSNRVLSSRALVELDCSGWRTRNVQFVVFEANNLMGAGSDDGSGDWRVAAPGTFGEAALESGCGD